MKVIFKTDKLSYQGESLTDRFGPPQGSEQMKMKREVVLGSFAALGLSALVLIACGDDEPSDAAPPTTTDGGGSPTADAAQTPDNDAAAREDGGGGGGTAAPIVPRSTTRMANAIDPYGLLFASDGFVYASGATIEEGARKLAVWRFKDGELDTTFGTDGVVTKDIPGNESSFDMVEVSPGSFVVQAVAGGKVWLVKLTKDGSGTYAFGDPVFVKFGWDENEGWPGGMTNPPSSPPSYTSWCIGLDKSNPASPKIVVFAHGAPPKAANVAEQRTDNDRWITRVMADTLAFDTTFNGGAPYSTDADGKNLGDNARRGIVLADGSMVSAGYTNFGQGLGNHVVLIRLLPNGTPDPAFGFGTSPAIPGQTKFNPFVSTGGFAEAYAVVQQSFGRLVTTGYGISNFETTSKANDLVSFGVKPDGLDTSYGKLGSFAWQSESDKSAGLGATAFMDRGRDLAVLPDDRLVHVGVYDDYASVFVLDKDGKPDPSSGVGGLIKYSYPAAFYKVAVSSDGKRIAATAQSVTQTADAGVAYSSVLVTLGVGQ
jgi:uncharacterized delta-60 repeat protein